MISSLLTVFLLFLPSSSSQSPLLGDWMTPDHSIIQVFDCADRICARIAKVGPKDAPKLDVNNPDQASRAQGLCGLTIGVAFEPDGPGQAKNGKLYDPKSGKTYSGEMTVEGNTLKLRGYIGFSMFGRTEIWHRTEGTIAPCATV